MSESSPKNPFDFDPSRVQKLQGAFLKYAPKSSIWIIGIMAFVSLVGSIMLMSIIFVPDRKRTTNDNVTCFVINNNASNYIQVAAIVSLLLCVIQIISMLGVPIVQLDNRNFYCNAGKLQASIAGMQFVSLLMLWRFFYFVPTWQYTQTKYLAIKRFKPAIITKYEEGTDEKTGQPVKIKSTYEDPNRDNGDWPVVTGEFIVESTTTDSEGKPIVTQSEKTPGIIARLRNDPNYKIEEESTVYDNIKCYVRQDNYEKSMMQFSAILWFFASISALIQIITMYKGAIPQVKDYDPLDDYLIEIAKDQRKLAIPTKDTIVT